MDQFSPETFYFLIVVSFIIWIVILYTIISNATYSKERRQMAESQLKLLVSMARKMGVDDNEIKKDIGIE